MKLIEKLIFWPGYFSSNLVYLRWDEESGLIDKLLSESDESALCIAKQGIVIGQQSTALQYHFNDLKRLQVFEVSNQRAENVIDEIDKLALVLFSLLKTVKREVKEQFGLTLSTQIEIVVLDFHKLFSGREIRFINSLKRYTQHPVDLVDAMRLMNTVLEKGKMGSAEVIVLADEGTNRAVVESASTARNVFHLDFQLVVKSLSDDLLSAEVPVNTIQYCISTLLKKLKAISENDWVEFELNDIGESKVNNVLIDRLHFDTQIKIHCQELFEKLNIKEQQPTIYVVGVYADYVSQFFNTNSEAKVEKLNRENFIKFMVANKLFSFRPDLGARKISITIDGDETNVLNVNNSGSAVEVLHSLRFFGRSAEKIVIEVNDEHGRFIKWDVIVNALTSLDICELPIHINADSKFNFDCKIASTDELYVTSIIRSTCDNERIRPVQAVNEVISIM